MLASVYDPQGKKQDAFNYAEQAIEAHRHEIKTAHPELINSLADVLSKMQPKILVQGVLVGDGHGGVIAAPYEEWIFTLEDGSTATKIIIAGDIGA